MLGGWFQQRQPPGGPPSELPPDAPPQPELDRIQRGERAARLLQDPLFESIFGDIAGDCYQAWLKTGPGEVERREELYRNIHALEIIRAKLRQYRGAGLMREAERKQERAA